MKIKSEHLAAMREKLLPLAGKIAAHRETVRASGKFNDLEKRVRWDLCNMAIPSKWICDTLYPYANDEHIDTALRVLVTELEAIASAAPDLLTACNRLLAAYEAGARNGGSIDWEDVDQAHELAVQAVRKAGGAS